MRSALALAVLLTACDGSGSLRVDLRTDLRPGYEFALVSVEVVDPTGATLRESRFLDRGADTLTGVTVAELDVPDGESRLTATIFAFDGTELLSRRQLVTVAGATSTVVYLSSNCLGVRCADPTPECVDGQCVAEGCGPDDLEACASATCASDDECAAAAACTRGVCREAFCLSEPDDAMCGAGEFCSAESGCVTEPGDAGPPPDAGDVDAGDVDAGGDDAGPPAPDAGPGGCELPVGALIAFDPGRPIPAGWTCVSCNAGEPLFERLPRGNDAAGAQGGSLTHTHAFVTAPTVRSTDVVRVSLVGVTLELTSTVDHVHPSLMGTSASASHMPPFATARYLRADVPQRTIPEGAVVMFGANPLPAGFVFAAAFDESFLRGGDAAESGGAETHQDIAMGTLEAAPEALDAATAPAGCLGATGRHRHTLDASEATVNDPPAMDLAFGIASAELPVPVDGVYLFLAPPPAGWTVISNGEDPAFKRFFRNSATPSLTETFGQAQHSSMIVRPVSRASEGESLAGDPSCMSVADTPRAAGSHDHDVQVTFQAATSLPPYTDVIVARPGGC